MPLRAFDLALMTFDLALMSFDLALMSFASTDTDDLASTDTDSLASTDTDGLASTDTDDLASTDTDSLVSTGRSHARRSTPLRPRSCGQGRRSTCSAWTRKDRTPSCSRARVHCSQAGASRCSNLNSLGAAIGGSTTRSSAVSSTCLRRSRALGTDAFGRASSMRRADGSRTQVADIGAMPSNLGRDPISCARTWHRCSPSLTGWPWGRTNRRRLRRIRMHDGCNRCNGL